MNADVFIDELAARGRVLVLGGLAVIAHGLTRSTRDADHETCKAALANPHDGVRRLAVSTLRRFAEDGAPFALEILREYERSQ